MTTIPGVSRKVAETALLLWILFACSDNKGVPEVIVREEWGAREPLYLHRLEKQRRDKESFIGICIHYSGFSVSVKPRLIQQYQMMRLNYPDVAYHFLIDRKGRVFQGRDTLFFSETSRGPDRYIHLCCISDMKFSPDNWLPVQQKRSLQKLILYLIDCYSINSKNVFFYDSTGYEHFYFL